MAQAPIISSGTHHTVSLPEGSHTAAHKRRRAEETTADKPALPPRTGAPLRASSTVYPQSQRAIPHRSASTAPPTRSETSPQPAADSPALGNAVTQRIAELKRRNSEVRIVLARQLQPDSPSV